jgi:alpha-ribazole phosphatase
MGVRLYFLRHGQTDSNKDRLFYGHTDTPLNATGHKEAKRAAEALQHIQFCAAYTSPLARAKETAEAVSQANDHPLQIIEDPELKEIYFGLWEGMKAAEIEARFDCEWRTYLENFNDFEFPDGDRVSDYYVAVKNAIENYLQKNKDGNILIVTHKGFICAALSCFLHGDFESIFKYDVDTGRSAVLDSCDGFYILKSLNA